MQQRIADLSIFVLGYHDVPRGTMDEVRSYVRLDLPLRSRFQMIHQCCVDVAHGLALLFGIGTRAVPSWGPRTRRNNLLGGVCTENLSPNVAVMKRTEDRL